jgi:hypothetical protein
MVSETTRDPCPNDPMCRYTDSHGASLHIIFLDDSFSYNLTICAGKDSRTWGDIFWWHLNPALVPEDARYKPDQGRVLSASLTRAGPPHGIALAQRIDERDQGEEDETAQSDADQAAILPGFCRYHRLTIGARPSAGRIITHSSSDSRNPW